MLKRVVPFFIIYLFVLYLYFPVLTTFFSHDDFFHFKVSITDGSLISLVRLFGFYPFLLRGIAFYRPLFRELLYNISYSLFGLNVLPFRIFQFLIHFVNIYLVFKFVQRIYKKTVISFFSAFFFGICAANVASFYYLAGGIQIMGATLFILLSLLFFDNYLSNNNSKYKILSFGSFFLALASHEQAAVIPLLIAGLILVRYKFKVSLKKIFKIWPYFLVVVFYLFLNLKVIGYSSSETQYRLVFNPKTTLNTLGWYTGWALGIPEMLIDFVNPGFRLNPDLFRYWGGYFKIIFSSLSISISLVSIYLILARKKLINRSVLFFGAWFILVILPVLFLPQHKSTYYLYPALPAFWTIIAIVSYNGFQSLKQKYFNLASVSIIVLISSLTALSSTSAILGKTTYWAAGRGKLAKKLIDDVLNKFPTLPKGSGILFTNDPTFPYISDDWKSSSKQAYFALNGEDGLQLLYKDNTLRVFYEDTGGVPAVFSKEKINSIVAIY